MLTGPELGNALSEAMRLKGVTQEAVAKEFKIRQPSVSEWLKFGRIGKRHINHLVEFFRDKVPPSHWGLPDSWTGEEPAFSAEATNLAHRFDSMKPAAKRRLRLMLEAAELEEVNNSGESPGNGESPPAAVTPSTHTATAGEGDSAGQGAVDWTKSRQRRKPLAERKTDTAAPAPAGKKGAKKGPTK